MRGIGESEDQGPPQGPMLIYDFAVSSKDVQEGSVLLSGRDRITGTSRVAVHFGNNVTVKRNPRSGSPPGFSA